MKKNMFKIIDIIHDEFEMLTLDKIKELKNLPSEIHFETNMDAFHRKKKGSLSWYHDCLSRIDEIRLDAFNKVCSPLMETTFRWCITIEDLRTWINIDYLKTLMAFEDYDNVVEIVKTCVKHEMGHILTFASFHEMAAMDFIRVREELLCYDYERKIQLLSDLSKDGARIIPTREYFKLPLEKMANEIMGLTDEEIGKLPLDDIELCLDPMEFNVTYD